MTIEPPIPNHVSDFLAAIEHLEAGGSVNEGGELLAPGEGEYQDASDFVVEAMTSARAIGYQDANPNIVWVGIGEDGFRLTLDVAGDGKWESFSSLSSGALAGRAVVAAVLFRVAEEFSNVPET